MTLMETLIEDLEKCIEKAIEKVQGTKENDLCKYLPGSSSGYIHHFTFRKLKSTDPQFLLSLIQKNIIEKDVLHALKPKQRAPRGSRKRSDLVNFSRSDIEKILDLARQVGDKDLVARFSPKRSLISLKKDLIRSIKENRVYQELWNAYAEAITMLLAL